MNLQKPFRNKKPSHKLEGRGSGAAAQCSADGHGEQGWQSMADLAWSEALPFDRHRSRVFTGKFKTSLCQKQVEPKESSVISMAWQNRKGDVMMLSIYATL